MFLRGFIKSGLMEAVGSMPSYWIKLNAVGWLEKGILTEDDLTEINAAIGTQVDTDDGEGVYE